MSTPNRELILSDNEKEPTMTHIRSPEEPKLNPKRNIVEHYSSITQFHPILLELYYSILYTMLYKNALEPSYWTKSQTKGHEIRRQNADAEVM